MRSLQLCSPLNGLAPQLAHDEKSIICVIRIIWDSITAAESNPDIRQSLIDIAYVIYTSGSTGTP